MGVNNLPRVATRQYDGQESNALTTALPSHRPVERGEGGKVFPGPATFGGPHQRSEILKSVFQMSFF